MTTNKLSAAELADTFRGDTADLIASINALLRLDADGALVPHGVGGHARTLLSSAAVRLASHAALEARIEKQEQRELALSAFAYDLGWNGHALDDIAADTLAAFNAQQAGGKS